MSASPFPDDPDKSSAERGQLLTRIATDVQLLRLARASGLRLPSDSDAWSAHLTGHQWRDAWLEAEHRYTITEIARREQKAKTAAATVQVARLTAIVRRGITVASIAATVLALSVLVSITWWFGTSGWQSWLMIFAFVCLAASFSGAVSRRLTKRLLDQPPSKDST